MSQDYKTTRIGQRDITEHKTLSHLRKETPTGNYERPGDTSNKLLISTPLIHMPGQYSCAIRVRHILGITYPAVYLVCLLDLCSPALRQPVEQSALPDGWRRTVMDSGLRVALCRRWPETHLSGSAPIRPAAAPHFTAAFSDRAK